MSDPMSKALAKLTLQDIHAIVEKSNAEKATQKFQASGLTKDEAERFTMKMFLIKRLNPYRATSILSGSANHMVHELTSNLDRALYRAIEEDVLEGLDFEQNATLRAATVYLLREPEKGTDDIRNIVGEYRCREIEDSLLRFARYR